MQIRLRRAAVIIFAGSIVVGLLLCPGLPWSKRYRHAIAKAVVRTEITLAAWRGKNPRLASIVGRATAGAEIHALDSRSGWSALSDRDGNFILRDVMWYPGAHFYLAIAQNERAANLITITAPDFLSGEFFDVGELQPTGEPENLRSLIGLNSITDESFDAENIDYYKTLCAKLTASRDPVEKQILAINDFVAGKLNYAEPARERESPRVVIERGSQFCGALANAMRTLLYATGYRSRAVNIIDDKSPAGTHVVVEVDYDGAWHLFDPTYGVIFRRADGQIAAYKDVRLDSALIRDNLFERFDPANRKQILELLRGAYATGWHHYYYFKGDR